MKILTIFLIVIALIIIAFILKAIFKNKEEDYLNNYQQGDLLSGAKRSLSFLEKCCKRGMGKLFKGGA